VKTSVLKYLLKPPYEAWTWGQITWHHLLLATRLSPHSLNTCLPGSTWRSQWGYCVRVCAHIQYRPCVNLVAIQITYTHTRGNAQTLPKNVTLMGKVRSFFSHLSPFIRLRRGEWPWSSFRGPLCCAVCVCMCVCSFRGRGRLTLMMWLWNRAWAQRRLSLRPSKFICYVGSACSCMRCTALYPCGFACTCCLSTSSAEAKTRVQTWMHMLNHTWMVLSKFRNRVTFSLYRLHMQIVFVLWLTVMSQRKCTLF